MPLCCGANKFFRPTKTNKPTHATYINVNTQIPPKKNIRIHPLIYVCILIHTTYLSLFYFFLYFCICSEENVWKLCEQVKKTRPAELAKCYAVYVSNEGRTVPLWRQKAGRGDDKVVIWVRIEPNKRTNKNIENKY